MKSAILIPAYNESATIRELVQRAMAQCTLVIVVDDGSTDNTVEQLTGLDVLLLCNDRNSGKAASLVRGFRAALLQNCDFVVTLDGDLQHRPEEIPRLVSAHKQSCRDIVIAARLKQRDQAPALRRFANDFADFWVSWAAGYPIKDSQSGFRLYPRAVLDAIDIDTSANHGFVFESEILIEAANQGYYSISVAVDSIYRKHARPSHYQPTLDTARIVKMIAGRLLRRGLFVVGLLRALGLLPDPRNSLKKTRRANRRTPEGQGSSD